MSHLRGLDVKLWADGDRLCYDAPQGALTSALRTQLREHKAEILAFLRQANLAAGTTLAPIQPVPRDGPLPLSLAQQRLWFVNQLEGESAAYNEAIALHFAGPLQVTALKRAVNEIVRRHEALRTTFAAVDGQPVQVIAPTLTLPVPEVDLGCLSKDEQTAAVKQLAREQARRLFDLAQVPLLRATLLKLSTRDSEHVLLITLHHIISDGWSTQVLIREWVTLYKAFSAGQPSPLPELAIQFTDFAIWQREWLSEEVLEDQLAYWRQRLAGAPSLLELPTDKPRPPVLTFKGSSLRFEIDQDLSEQLRALSRQAGTSLFVTLYAAWASLLSCYSARKDIVIAAPTANRNRKEIEPLIGFFVNTLMLRIDLSGDPTFHEIIERARLVTLEAFAHQDVPPEKLVEALRVPRDLSHAPLAQVAFALQDFAASPETLPGLVVTPWEIDPGTAKTDLSVLMKQDAGGRLQGVVEYSTDLFEPATIAQVTQDLRRLLSAIASDPARRLSSLLEASGITTMPLTTPQAEREKAADVYARSNLTRNQYLIWMGQKLQPDVPLYDMADVFTLSGELRPEHFQQAFQALVKSSDALRTVIEEIDGVPQQRVVANVPDAIAYLDFSQVPETEFRAWVHQRLQKPLNFEKCPFDSALIKLADEKYVWFLRCHSIVLDGLSFYLVMVPRVLESYKRSLQGLLEKEIKELHPFRDYVAYEREHRNSPRYAQAEVYWKQKLAQSIEPIRFYGKYPPRQTTRVQRVFCELGRERTARLKAVAAQMDVSKTSLSRRLFSVFATLLGAFLYHVGDVRHLSFGTPFHNRRGSFKQTIGMLMEVLPLRVTIERDDTFLSLSKKVAIEVTETLQHSQYAVGNPPQNKSYDVFVNYLAYSFPSLPGITMTEEWIHSGHGNDSLALQILNETASESIVLAFDFHCDVFDAGQQDQAMQHFLRVLDAFLADPTQSITELNLLSAGEDQRVLIEFNQTKTLLPEHQTVTRLFEAQAQKTPDRIAVECQAQALTFAFLKTRANQLAHHLQSLGVGPDVPVGLCVERSPDMIVGLLGILKAGGAYVPLDPAYPQERLAFMLRDAAGATCGTDPILLTQTKFAPALPEIEHLITVYLDADWAVMAQERAGTPPTSNSVCEAMAQNLAYVMYTSGSTGRPKGVMIEHRNLAWYTQVAIAQYKLAPDDRVLQFNTLSFDISVEEIFSCLGCGATLVLRNDEMMGSIPGFLQTCQDWGITWLSLPAAFWHELATGLAEEPRRLPPSLRLVILGGDKVLSERVMVWRRHAGQQVQLMNTYGPTEATVVATLYDLSGVKEVTADWQAALIGRVVSGAQVYILDPNLRPAPIGIPGELHVGGGGPARGYLNSPGLTAEKFMPHPFPPSVPPPGGDEGGGGARLYKTGDLARYLPDGNIEFLGRVDHQVKIRGFRVELGEIEAVLEQHPALQEAVVLAREDELGNKQLVAYGVADAGQAPTMSELRNFLLERLPQYMVPSTFVTLEALPLTPSGKVDRLALPPPDRFSSELSKAFVAPRTPIEKTLAAIWADILGLEQIGIHDNFFELGGHSLLAIQFLSRVRDAFQVDLPLRNLFNSPTIAGLAMAIAQHKRQKKAWTSLPTLMPAPQERHLPFPLTDVQQAYWIGRGGDFELGNVAAHGYLEFENTGVDVERLEWACQRLIERHDMLRAIVRPDGQQQVLEQVTPYRIEVLDLRGQDAEAAAAQLAALRERMSHQVLPSDRWPLFKIRASRLTNQRVRIHISLDALISDAWSWQILGHELIQLYQNPETPLTPLEISFRDYVLAEVALHESELYQRSLAYWQSRLPTLPPGPELPLARSPGSLAQPQFVRRAASLEPEAWGRLKERAARAGLTPSGLLAAAFAEVLTVWSKNPRFTINLTLFNRLPLHPQVNDIVGDFTSLTLLEVGNSTPEGFEVRARRLQEQLWQDLDHRYVSGVRVMRELAQKQGGTPRAAMPVVFTSTLAASTPIQETPSWTGLKDDAYSHSISQTPQVWLDHQVVEQGGALFTNWDAVEALFPPGLLDDVFAAYNHLLSRLAHDEQAWQETTPQLVPIPATQLAQRSAVNATHAPLPSDLLHILFAAQVPQRPDQPAVIAPNRTLTYQELYRRANQVGHWLRHHGAQLNHLVAVLMDKGWEQVVAVLGVLQSGAAYLPIAADLPQERVDYLLHNGQVSLALTQSWLDQDLTWPQGIRRLCVDDESALQDLDDVPLTPLQGPHDLAYVIYTSGSTGQPKGVKITHQGAANTILDVNRRFGVGPADRVLALSRLGFDLSVYDVFGLLAAGGALVFPDAAARRDPAHWAELMQQHRVTLWNSVPALMELLVEYVEGRFERLPDALRVVFLSGDWIPLTLPDRIRALAAGVQVFSGGGATEASIWSILYPIERVDPAWSSVPYGKPLANQHFHVLDQALNPRPVWVPGQLYIGGAGLAQGYWRDEDKTAASFIPAPPALRASPPLGEMEGGERLYRTGDLGRYLPDGDIEFLGREDAQVKIRGHRIELGEIEAALGGHPFVQAGVVAAVSEKQDGRGPDKRLVAYVVPDWELVSTHAANLGESRHALEEHLPQDYQLSSAEGELLDPLARLRFKLSHPGLRRENEDHSCFQLVKPELDQDLLETYAARRSYRKFLSRRVSFERFGRFLSCLFQIKADGLPLPKSRYGSAGGLYPVQVYLYVKPGRVEGLPAGTYYYHPQEHRLRQLFAGDFVERSVYQPGNREIFDSAAWAIFLIAQMDAITPMYARWARDFCMLEAGLMTQLLETAAPVHQIGLCQIGGLDFEPLRQWFDLRANHVYLHSLLGGPIDVEPSHFQGLVKDSGELLAFLKLFDPEPAQESSSPSKQFAPPATIQRNPESTLHDVLVHELLDLLKQKLPEYMVPLVFVPLETLPLTPNGKVDRRALPLPEWGSPASKTTFVAPRTPTEKKLAQIWTEILQVERVGVHDNFAMLGGHSLLATQVIARVRDVFEIELPLRTIFEAPTVAGLAQTVDALCQARSSVVIPAITPYEGLEEIEL
jgi:amino acid adenylation domain-containing protein